MITTMKHGEALLGTRGAIGYISGNNRTLPRLPVKCVAMEV
jgi:hypothetical protein